MMWALQNPWQQPASTSPDYAEAAPTVRVDVVASANAGETVARHHSGASLIPYLLNWF